MQGNHSALGTVLKRNRLQQKQVALALGVSRFTVWQWSQGRTVPSGTNLARLLAYLQTFEPALQVGDLLGKAA